LAGTLQQAVSGEQVDDLDQAGAVTDVTVGVDWPRRHKLHYSVGSPPDITAKLYGLFPGACRQAATDQRHSWGVTLARG
jgi:hypothetical protein